jgi:hypothetical protein
MNDNYLLKEKQKLDHSLNRVVSDSSYIQAPENDDDIDSNKDHLLCDDYDKGLAIRLVLMNDLQMFVQEIEKI